MSRFFDKFFSDTCYIDGIKMREVDKIIESRNESLSFSLSEFLILLGDKLLEIQEVDEDSLDESHINYEHVQRELEIAHVRISLMMCMLAEYFYPIIEYVQKASNDGIRPIEGKAKRLGSR